MKMKVLIEDKNYTNWKYYEADSFQEINLENNINPAIFKLFTEDANEQKPCSKPVNPYPMS